MPGYLELAKEQPHGLRRISVEINFLREHCGIDSKTVRRLKANENMETKTLNKLCAFLDCKLDDIAEFVPD